MRGILEELEKAHVYIGQLNKLLKDQQEVITELKKKVNRLEKQIR